MAATAGLEPAREITMGFESIAVAQGCMLHLLCEVRYVVFSVFSARHYPHLAGLRVVPHSPFVLVFAFCLVPPPPFIVACGRVLMLVSLVFAPVFFNSLSSSPPPAMLKVRGRVLTVVCLTIAPFSSRPPRPTGGTRQVFDGWFALL